MYTKLETTQFLKICKWSPRDWNDYYFYSDEPEPVINKNQLYEDMLIILLSEDKKRKR
jgi:hypothetical protein